MSGASGRAPRGSQRRLSVGANFNIVKNLIVKGDARQLRQLLLSAPTLRASLRGTTEPALHVAMSKKEFGCAEVLIDMGVSLNATGIVDGKTALHVAVECNFFEGVALLLARRAKVDALDSKHRSPLHMAASSAHPDADNILDALLDSGANVGLRDQSGRCAAHFAAAADNVQVLSIVHRADDQQITATDFSLATPLHDACRQGALTTLEWLIDQGVNTRARDEDVSTPGAAPPSLAPRAAPPARFKHE
eukprot:7379566-Prymnesium_polylepis.1